MGGLILPRVDSAALTEREDSLDKYGQPLDYTYLTGLYLAVNAISDTAAFIDGPDCVMGKAEHVFGKHDFNSTILDCVDHYRIFFSGTDVRNTVLSREEAIGKALLKFKERPDMRAIFFAAMPMCLLTGTDYVKVARNVSEELQKPVVHIPSNSLRAFFLEGYGEALKGLAESLEFSSGQGVSHQVGIVGHFMDRTEEDHRANIREMTRMVESLGLNVVSVWPNGGSLKKLKAIEQAGTIVSLPYAREAARIIAQRTGARIFELNLPLGLENSAAWMIQLGKYLGCEERSSEIAREEKAKVLKSIGDRARRFIEGKKFMIAADPHALLGIESLISEFDGEVVSRVSVGQFPQDVRHGPEFSLKPRILERPTAGLLRREWARVRDSGVDCVIANGDVRRMIGEERAFVEFGYPAYFYHALSPHPFLGFEGTADFVGRIVGAMSKKGTVPFSNEKDLSLPELERTAAALGLDVAEIRPSFKEAAPLGFMESADWVKNMGLRFSRLSQAEAFVDQQMRAAIPRLEWVIPFLFLNKKFAFFGEDSRVLRIRDVVEELGARVVSIRQGVKLEDIDLLISNADGVSLLNPNCAVFNPEAASCFGPSAGFAGTLFIIDSMANAMLEKLAAPLG